jgi:hypothetical protein
MSADILTLRALFQAPLADPDYLKGFDSLGHVAILVGVIIGLVLFGFWLIRQFQTGKLGTQIRHTEALAIKDSEISELKEAREEDRRTISTLRDDAVRQHNDLVRLTDEVKNMTLHVIGAVIGREPAREAAREAPSDKEGHG